MHRRKCEFYAETEAAAKPNEWKKTNARAVSIIAQIIEMPSTGPGACVIRVEYESGGKCRADCSSTDQGGGKRRGAICGVEVPRSKIRPRLPRRLSAAHSRGKLPMHRSQSLRHSTAAVPRDHGGGKR